MGKHGGNKKKSTSSSGSIGKQSSKVAVEIKDIKFESSGSSSTENEKIKVNESASASNSPSGNTSNINVTVPSATTATMNNIGNPSNKLEKILNELEKGCFVEEEKNGNSAVAAAAAADAVGFLRKKMAALGFQAGIQLSGGGAFRDARRILDGFPGDDEYELTFEEVESDEEEEEDLDEEFDEDSLLSSDLNADLLNGSLDGLNGLDPLRILSGKTTTDKSSSAAPGNSLNYPLIDPLKLQVIQSAESELTTVHDLFESTTISASQKLPLLKRKYMELMQQDIRHRLESLRIRDYLDTLHLERQVVERELEKAVNLRSSMEQLCEKLQAENSKIRAEKAGITSKIYGDLELKALEEELLVNETTTSSTNGAGSSTSKKGNSKKQQQKKSGSGSVSPTSSTSNFKIPSLPETAKSISFEVPDANKLLEGAQGDLKARFRLLIDLYNQREQHFCSVLRAKDLEIQMLQGHFYAHQNQIQKISQSNRELNGKINDLSSSESDLRSQLGVYVDKFKQVEDTLSKSNDLFATFRHEMEQMTSKLGRLERENGSLQSKCATLSRNIIEMADERSKQSATIELLKNQKSKLESLCRTLQMERNSLLKLQKEPEEITETDATEIFVETKNSQ